MIAAIIRWSISNRGLVLFLMLMLALAGGYALKRMPLDAIPDLSDVQVIIKTTYSGQAPQVVEDQITYPLTTAMLSVPGAKTVRGYSFFNDSYVYILFEEGTDLYWARARVLEYLSQVAPTLPREAKPALGPDATGVGWIFQYALVDRTGNHDVAELRSLQDWFLKYELQTVEGVSEVATFGGVQRQYQVIVEPARLRAFGLTLADIKRAVLQANGEVGGRVIEMAEAEYMVRAGGYITSREDLENAFVSLDQKGVAILLKDVARVRLGPELRRGLGELNGEGEVVGGIVVMRWGENALATIDRVKARLSSLSKSLPDGVEIVPTYDRSQLIDRAIDTLMDKLTEELLVVTAVCAVFLFHLRSAVVVLISLPLAVLGAFLLMYVQGINANIMSLGGIAIAIGAMVDAAIVMIETYHKKMEAFGGKREERWQAVSSAAVEVGPSLFFSLLIITLSFTPIFVLEAQEGRLFHPLAFTKTYAMATAAVLSITLVPVLIGFLVRGGVTAEQRNPVSRLLAAAYRPLISVVLRFPVAVVFLTLVLVGSVVIPISKLGSEFMPEFEEGDILYMPSAHPGISGAKMIELLQQTNKMIMTVPEVLSVHAKAGRAATATDPAPLPMIESVIQLKPEQAWRPGMTPAKIRQALDEVVQVPGLTNAWINPIKARIDMLSTGIKTPVGIKVSGPDLSVISDITWRIERALAGMEETQSAFAERVSAGRYISINIDRLEAARLGLSIRDLHDIIAAAVGGMTIDESVEGRERYPINIRYPEQTRGSVERLRQLPVLTPSGGYIPLGAVADVAVEMGPGMIRSENARPTGWVYVEPASEDIAGYVASAQNTIEALDLPNGYSISWSGQYEYMERAKEKLQIVIPATILVIIVLLFLNFRDGASVAIIMATLPLALVGGVWLLYLLDFQLSVAVGVGFIALAGVAVEIGVLMLVYLNMARKEAVAALQQADQMLTRDHLKAVIVQGTLRRIRPIIMTVAATIAGLLPIMNGGGTGAEVMQRIAAPMVGGMVSVTVLALLVIPAVYLLWHGRSLKEG